MLRSTVLPSILVLALGLAGPASAQMVRGQITEEGTQNPVEGAMVLLLELDERVVHRVLSDAAGGFLLDAAHPGVYLLRVDRIGYESLTTERFEVPPEGTFRRVVVPIRPVELAGIAVEGSRRCEVRGEQGAATARVWEEARKALAAAAWTLELGVYRYTLLQYERTLEADGRTVRNEDRRFERGAGQAPYVSVPAEELAEEGFIRQNPDRTLTYLAPDAAAFLSEAFLDTHCMRLEKEQDGQVGLAFEPIRGRRLPDIRGTLWMDAATARLRRLEFTYVNVPPDRDAGNAGGEVVFGPLPNGTWIVRDWNIRMPLLTTNPQRTRLNVTGYRVRGGTVWRVLDRGGATVVEAASASISGSLSDSLGARPLSGARVRALDVVEGDDAVTDEAGSFRFAELPPGLHRLEVRHPSLDTLGLGPFVAPVETTAGEVASARLRLPGVTELLVTACSATPRQARETAPVLGRVREGARPARGAPVRVRWLGGDRRGFDISDRAAPPLPSGGGPRWATDTDDPRWLATTLDHRGIFLVCAVPAGTQLLVEVGAGDEARRTTVDVPLDASVVIVPLTFQARDP